MERAPSLQLDTMDDSYHTGNECELIRYCFGTGVLAKHLADEQKLDLKASEHSRKMIHLTPIR